MIGALALATLAAAAGAAPLAERLRKPVTALRGAPEGALIPLPDGIAHVRRYGPSRGPVALCVHGLTTPGFAYAPLATRLVAQGFRVFAPDLWGRGLSDRVQGVQDAGLFVRQIEGVAEALDLGEDMTVFGYSMGAIITAEYARAHPARVRRLVLLAPAGLGHDLGRFARFCADTPVAGDWAIRALGGIVARRAINRAGPPIPELPDLPDRQAAETRVRGTLPAHLNAARHALCTDMTATHRALGVAGLPVMAVWGGADRVIPLSAMGRLAQAHRNVRQVVIDGAGHAMPMTHARAVAEAIEAFLAES